MYSKILLIYRKNIKIIKNYNFNYILTGDQNINRREVFWLMFKEAFKMSGTKNICLLVFLWIFLFYLIYDKKARRFIIHSKYFCVPDWLKSHA